MTKLKTAILLPTLLLLLLVPMFFNSNTVTASPTNDVQIGVYYYPWYVGNWSDSHANCVDTPILGGYDSSNASVIVKHLNWLQQAGIDFIIFSWWGKNSSSDNNTQLILNQIASNYTEIEFFLMVEPFGNSWPQAYNQTSGTYNFTAIYDYLFETYTSKYPSNCFLLGGKPAVGFYDDPTRNLTSNDIPQDTRFSIRLIGSNPEDDWEYQVPNPTLSTQPVCRDGEISVCPRYDANGWHEDVNLTQGIYGVQWSRAIDEARKGNVNIVTIISWNEFAERTQIEPHIGNITTASPYYLLDLTKAYIDYLHLTKYPMKHGVLAHEMTDAQAQSLASNGFQLIADVEINNSNSNWQNIYQLSKGYNITLVGKLLPRTMNFNNSSTLQDWNQTVTTAVAQYGDVVKTWEIWNEPTSNGSYLGYYDGNASKYTEMLQIAHRIIKSAQPEATILGLGGLHLYSGDESIAGQGLNFTMEVVSLGGMDYCDAVSLHAYPWGAYSNRAERAFIDSIVKFREITGKDIWITEIGQQTRGTDFNESEQAYFLNQSYILLSSQNVKAYTWYELNDRGNETFGLYDTNSNPKTAYTTYLSAVNPPSPPDPTQTPKPTTAVAQEATQSTTIKPVPTYSPIPVSTPMPTQTPTSTATATPTSNTRPIDPVIILLLGIAIVIGVFSIYLLKLKNKCENAPLKNVINSYTVAYPSDAW